MYSLDFAVRYAFRFLSGVDQINSASGGPFVFHLGKTSSDITLRRPTSERLRRGALYKHMFPDFRTLLLYFSALTRII